VEFCSLYKLVFTTFKRVLREVNMRTRHLGNQNTLQSV